MVEEKKLTCLLQDLLFKEAFTNKENEEQLISFVSSVTEISREELRKDLKVHSEYSLNKASLKNKTFRGDIIVECKDYIINIEAYTYFSKTAIEKSTSYIMRIFGTQLEVGDTPKKLKKAIQINLISGNKTKIMKKLERTFLVIDEKDASVKLIKDNFKSIYFNIDEIMKMSYDKSDKKMRWLHFIGAKDNKEREEIAKGDEEMEKMNNWIEKYINNDETLEIYAEWAEKIAHEHGKEEGVIEGKKAGIIEGKKVGIIEGKKEERKDVATRLKKLNISIDDIMKATGLKKKEIENL